MQEQFLDFTGNALTKKPAGPQLKCLSEEQDKTLAIAEFKDDGAAVRAEIQCSSELTQASCSCARTSLGVTTTTGRNSTPSPRQVFPCATSSTECTGNNP